MLFGSCKFETFLLSDIASPRANSIVFGLWSSVFILNILSFLIFILYYKIIILLLLIKDYSGNPVMVHKPLKFFKKLTGTSRGGLNSRLIFFKILDA